MSEPTAPPPPPAAPNTHVEIGEWFNAAWGQIKPFWLEYVLAILVLHLVLFVASLFCYVPALVIGGPMMGGLYVYLAKRTLKVPAEVGDIFMGFRRFTDTALLYAAIFLIPVVFGFLAIAPMLMGSVFGSIIPDGARDTILAISGGLGCFGVVAGVLFLLVYPLIVGTFFLFAFPLVMFKKMGAMEALKLSAGTVKMNFTGYLMLLLASVVLFLAAEFLGLLACGIGLLILAPLASAIVFTMHIYAYRQAFGLTVEELSFYQ